MSSKTTTIQIRVDEELKKKAEAVCNRMGISMSQAIRMFLRYVVEQDGIPAEYFTSNKAMKMLKKEP